MQTMRAFLAATLLFAMAATAQAADYYVEITNRTGYTILYLNVSPAKSTSWEEDVLGNSVLPNGQTRRVDLYGYTSPIFDIRLTDEDGDTYTFFNIDVSRQDLVVTLDDID
jgi:hypothetical protein